MWVMRVLMLLIAFNLFVAHVKAEPIYDSNSPFLTMYSDQTAHQVGDIITIRLTEILSNKQESTSKTSKGFSITNPVGTGFLHFINSALSGSATSTSNSDRAYSDSDSLITTFAVRVIKVDANGNLVVSGTHQVVVNNEKRIVTLSGVVRQKDVDGTNGVSSTQVADLAVDVAGEGKSPGIISKILRVLF